VGEREQRVRADPPELKGSDPFSPSRAPRSRRPPCPTASGLRRFSPGRE
jgi:hypothetical protein